MTIRKVTKEVRVAGEYVDQKEYGARVDHNGALKVVPLNHRPGRAICFKGFKFTAEPAWNIETPRTTESDWVLPYGIDLVGGSLKTINSTDGDKVELSVLIPHEDGSTEEIKLVEDLYLYKGQHYDLGDKSSIELPVGLTIRISYTNIITQSKEIFYNLKIYR